MKWVAITNYNNSQGQETFSIAEVSYAPWNKKGIVIWNTGIFQGNILMTSIVSRVRRILKSIIPPISVAVFWTSDDMDNHVGRVRKMHRYFPLWLPLEKIQTRIFDRGELLSRQVEGESLQIAEIMSQLDFKQGDLTTPNIHKIEAFWVWFAVTQVYRSAIKGNKDTKFISVKTPHGSILWQILTQRWIMTDAFWRAFCAVTKTGNVCIKPLWWDPNLPFVDVIAALLADKDDKVTGAEPTIVWANKVPKV